MGVSVLIPLMVTVFDTITVFTGTSVWAVKLKASGVVSGPGVVSAASVVTLNVPATPPMVSVAVEVVEDCVDVWIRTVTVCPLDTEPAAGV